MKFDAIIIGTGQAGPSLAARLDSEGLKTAVIERKDFGGTCVNTGCTPTKALVASARAAFMARHGRDYGVEVGEKVSVDMKKVKQRKDLIVKNSNQGLATWLEGMKNVTIFHAHGRFEGPHTVNVNDEMLEADRIFINVGARAAVPPVPGLDSVPFLNNSSMMDVDFLPEHLLIIGGGYIALEFGQMYRRFGSRVTILERAERLVSQEDDDVSKSVREILEKEGIAVLTNASDYRVDQRDGKITIKMKDRELTGTHLLVATGRRPNTDDLGLEKAGIKTSKKGTIEVDDELKTNVDGVWAMGECNGLGAFTHTSYNDYEIVAANLFDNDPRRVSDRIPAYAMYIDPPIGRAGQTERQVRESGRKALIGTRPMTKVSRAIEKGETQGFMKILVDAETRKILGAAILGVGGDEVIHSILDVMYAQAPYTVMQRAVHIHPTVSELVPTMLGELKPLE